MKNISVNTLKYLTDVHELLNIITYFKAKGIKFILDFTNLSFVSPIGAIALLQLFEEFNEPEICQIKIPESNRKVITYIERINFFNYCPEKLLQEFEELHKISEISQRNRYDQKKALLEITKIANDDDIDVLYESTVNILKSHNMPSKQFSGIANILTELGANILDHSESTGYAAIQYYPKEEKIMIGIADKGIGIVNSVRKTVKDENISDLEIIEKAFSDGFTTSRDTERGLGLTEVRDYSHKGVKKTNFKLRTHNGLYNIGKDKIKIIFPKNNNYEMYNKNYYPGTYYSIEIEFNRM